MIFNQSLLCMLRDPLILVTWMQQANMNTTPVYALLLCILATIALARGQMPCIEDSEVGGIAQRWLNAFATGGLSSLSDAVTENVHEIFLTCILTSS